VAASWALSERLGQGGGYRSERSVGDVAMAPESPPTSVRATATPSEARRFAPKQPKRELVWPARAERTDRRVAQAHRLDGEVGLGVVMQLPFQHVRDVVKRAEQRLAGSLCDDDLAGLRELLADDGRRHAKTLEDARQRRREARGQVLDVARRHEYRQPRSFADEQHVALVADGQRLGVPVAERGGRLGWIGDRRTDPRQQLLGAAEDEHARASPAKYVVDMPARGGVAALDHAGVAHAWSRGVGGQRAAQCPPHELGQRDAEPLGLALRCVVLVLRESDLDARHHGSVGEVVRMSQGDVRATCCGARLSVIM